MKSLRLNTLIALFVIGLAAVVYATTAGPSDPNAATNVVIDTDRVDWVNVNNSLVADDVYSDSTYSNIGFDITPSDYLADTDYGFAIPGTATIDGITLSVPRKCST